MFFGGGGGGFSDAWFFFLCCLCRSSAYQEAITWKKKVEAQIEAAAASSLDGSGKKGHGSELM